MSSYVAKKVVLLLMGILYAATSGCRPPANEYVPPPAPEVAVARPLQRTVTTYLDTTGTTEPFETVEIRARVDGFLEEIHFEPGDDVQRRQQAPPQ